MGFSSRERKQNLCIRFYRKKRGSYRLTRRKSQFQLGNDEEETTKGCAGILGERTFSWDIKLSKGSSGKTTFFSFGSQKNEEIMKTEERSWIFLTRRLVMTFKRTSCSSQFGN